ncbi:MAG: S8 family serine peptidase, partial [Pseudomonadota bacterium]|nr:S8 family serine peptidase [Pseudomonadota bacterium]
MAALLLTLASWVLPADVVANNQRVIVEYRNHVSGNVKEDLHYVGGQTKRSIHTRNLMAVTLDNEMLDTLKFSPNVVAIETDHRRYPLAQSQPYGLDLIQAPELSAGTPRKVCIIDTGYELSHPDLPNNNGATRVTGISQIEGESWDLPGHAHGTHVAGTIAALDNTTGVIGAYPETGLSLHIVKIFDDTGSWTYTSDLIAAVDSCVSAGAHVINMSLGGSGSSTAEANVFSETLAAGVLPIAAAGNSGGTSLGYPASYDAVVSVAAVDSSEEHASFSTRNEQVEIAAPGVNILSTVINGGYESYSGTSMATPHVAAGAALLWSNHDSCTAEEIRQALNKASKDLGAAGRDNSYGYGLIQIKAAHDAIVSAGSCDVGPIVPPEIHEALHIENVSGNSGEKSHYSFDVPANATNLSISISGGSGDANLHLKQGSPPTISDYDCRPYVWGNEETCSVTSPTEGVYHAMIHAVSSYSGVTLIASYALTEPNGDPERLSIVVDSVGASSNRKDLLIDELANGSQNLGTNWNNDGRNANAWFTLDLGASYDVSEVFIAPRADRPHTFNIHVGDTLSSGKVTAAAVGTCTPQQEGLSNPTYLKSCSINETTGRYVTLQVIGRGWLRVHGVEIWGSSGGSGGGDTDPPTVPDNVAGSASSSTAIALSWDASTDVG